MKRQKAPAAITSELHTTGTLITIHAATATCIVHCWLMFSEMLSTVVMHCSHRRHVTHSCSYQYFRSTPKSRSSWRQKVERSFDFVDKVDFDCVASVYWVSRVGMQTRIIFPHDCGPVQVLRPTPQPPPPLRGPKHGIDCQRNRATLLKV